MISAFRNILYFTDNLKILNKINKLLLLYLIVIGLMTINNYFVLCLFKIQNIYNK